MSELYVAQHRAAPAAGEAPTTRTAIGYFPSFEEASDALEMNYEPGCWQGIRREASRHRWWRDE